MWAPLLRRSANDAGTRTAFQSSRATARDFALRLMGGSGRVIERKLIATVRRESAVMAAAVAAVPENSYIFPALERSRHGLRNHQRHAGHAAHWRRGRRLDARQAAQQPPGRGVAPGAGGASGPVLSRSAARREIGRASCRVRV